ANGGRCGAACPPVFPLSPPPNTPPPPPPPPPRPPLTIPVPPPGGGLHERRVRAVCGLGDPERETLPSRGQLLGPLRPLLWRPVVKHQQQADVVTDDHVLVLQIAMQAKALARQVLADHRHA